MNPALLRWLVLGPLRSAPGRALASVVAVAIGVALALAIELVNRSALDEFGSALAVINGEAQWQLKARTGFLDESVFDDIVNASAVAAASPLLELDTQVARLALVPADGGSDAPRRALNLTLIGLDVLRAAAVHPALLPAPERPADAAMRAGVPSVFGDDTVFLSQAALHAAGLRVGDRIVLRASLREVPLRIAGTLPGAAAGQRLAVMDLGAMQWRFAALGRLSRIDLKLAEGARRDTLLDAAPASLRSDSLVWVTPDHSRQRMSNLSRAYRVNLNVLALVAVLTGALIVQSTLSLSVLRQLPQLALLGVLGAAPAMRRRVVLLQGLVLGASGALLGLLLGIGLAAGILGVLGGDLGGGYFQGSRPELSIDAPTLIAFALMGILTGLAASGLPAQRGSQLPPMRVLRSGGRDASGLSGRERGGLRDPARRGALVLLGLAAVLLMMPPLDGLPWPAHAAIALWLVAGILWLPTLLLAAGRLALRLPALSEHRPALWLALQRLQALPERTSLGLAGVVSSFALACAMAVMVLSFRVSVSQWLDAVLPADVYARASATSVKAGLDPAAQDALRARPEFRRVEFLRTTELLLDPSRPPVALITRTLEPAREAQRLPLTGAALTVPDGRLALWVSEAMVDLYGWTPGREVTLPIQGLRGPAPRFFVAGVWRDYSRQHGAVVLSSRDWVSLTGDESQSDLALWLAGGVDEDAARRAVAQAVPGAEGLELRSAREIRAISLRVFDRSFAVTWVLEAVAIAVALFGVAAAWSGEALAREREFGVLRHLGFTRRQVLRAFTLESGLLILIAVLWGACLGAVIAVVLVHRVNPQSFHWTMDMHWPAGLLLVTGLSLVGLGMLAARLAGRSATRASPIRSLREDW